MYWFYIDKNQIENKHIRISGSDVNHIKNVLRLSAGEKIAVCDGQGKDYYCIISEVSKEEVEAEIIEEKNSESELDTKLYLFQGLPKKDKMELIIQKAVELGIYEIIPVKMKNCVVKIEDKKKENKKLERWQSIAEAASKQSKRGIIPKIKEIMSFEEALEYAEKLEYGIVPYEKSIDIQLSRKIIKAALDKNSIGIFIGPEGGFDDKEIDKVMKAGLKPITLGKRILRTETAGLTILSILMFELEV